jgi:hypothetical protein
MTFEKGIDHKIELFFDDGIQNYVPVFHKLWINKDEKWQIPKEIRGCLNKHNP